MKNQWTDLFFPNNKPKTNIINSNKQQALTRDRHIQNVAGLNMYANAQPSQQHNTNTNYTKQ